MTDTDDFQLVKRRQSRGPTLEFQGKLLAETDWNARDAQMRLEIWQTPAGALIPVTIGTPYQEDRREILTAAVIQPGDEQEMRFAVMDFFDWTDHARSMVRKQLRWSLKQIVE